MRTRTSARPELPLAVVAGAGGMGMAIARRLGERHRLLLADIDAEHLDRMATALTAEGHDVHTARCDITDRKMVSALASAASRDGPIRVLAHVTGLSPSMADWRTILRVNLIGARLVMDAFLPLAGQGMAAIFVGSLAGHIPEPGAPILALLDTPEAVDFLDRLGAAIGDAMTPTHAYQLSKFMLMRLCRQRAAAWGAQGARIVSLSPGLIATPMGALEFAKSPGKHSLLERTPIRREGTMLEIADALEFLASDRASFITGTDLLVDGGIAAVLRHG